MSDAANADQDRRQRVARVVSLVGVVLVGAIGYTMVTVAGDRALAERVDELRQAASAAQIDPALLAASVSASEGNPIAAVFEPEVPESIKQLPGGEWCVEVEVEEMLSSETLFFVVDDSGRFAETSRCG